MGIGISTFTEIVGAGPSDTFDILGIKMFDSAEIRVHPTGSAIVRIGVQTQGQGHETTFAQIVAEELGLPVENIEVEHGDTDTAPYGLGTYASRSTPTAGAATAMAFFGFSGVLQGYLIFRSTFLPRWLGVLAMICGFCWLLFLYPPLGRSAFGITAIIGLLSSVLTILWLLVKGVDVAKWNASASAAAQA